MKRKAAIANAIIDSAVDYAIISLDAKGVITSWNAGAEHVLGWAASETLGQSAGLKVLQSDARIDLLVSDVGLHGGMNGRQMADAARASRPDLKVLFITGYAENAAVGNGQLAPGMHVMTKPFGMEALATRIRTLIEDAELIDNRH